MPAAAEPVDNEWLYHVDKGREKSPFRRLNLAFDLLAKGNLAEADVAFHNFAAERPCGVTESLVLHESDAAAAWQRLRAAQGHPPEGYLARYYPDAVMPGKSPEWEMLPV